MNLNVSTLQLLRVVAVTLSLGGVTIAQSTSSPAESAEMSAARSFIDAKDWPAAIKALKTMTDANPKNFRAWFLLGFSLHSKGEFANAVPAYRKAAESPQIRPLSRYNIACAMAKQNKVEDAFAELDLAIDAGFANLKQMKEDADLVALHADTRWAKAIRRVTPIPELVKELKFWVGEWDVFDPKGVQVGTSRIELAERGCLVVENWSNMTGGTGRSFNFVDPGTRRWHQVWVDPAGTVVRYEGMFNDGAMRLSGINQPAQGMAKKTRMTLNATREGKVHQVIEHSTDDGATWSLYFDGLYVKSAK